MKTMPPKEFLLMTTEPFHFYEPKDGHALPHNPFNAIVAPRPIGWISSLSAAGERNLAPYSFFNALNYTPPLIGFSSTGPKDSVANIEETGEFVWNLVTEAQAQAMSATSAAVERGVDEFDLAGLRALPSHVVKAPRVEGSPVHFECRCTQIIPLKDAGGKDAGAFFVVGEVVGVHIALSALEDGIYQTARPVPILRAGGPDGYVRVTDDTLFAMPRPATP